eukprot:TRINITY_DN20844_c0_g1_i1.p1 TRINITY_DN20844_c0_g1~~TRINITY_DN20844_c0_g1_i1.p1  ORF type:complete len:201 (+),score=6.84 TRINITY_DN20844_c0_g1_i1:355-957(+)
MVGISSISTRLFPHITVGGIAAVSSLLLLFTSAGVVATDACALTSTTRDSPSRSCETPVLSTTSATNNKTMSPPQSKNVYGGILAHCCSDPVTGFYRNGYCQTGTQDQGTHVACAQLTDAFLQFSKSRGNDLMTPRPEYSFPGLKAGDSWCLCAMRWTEALAAGVAPPLNLEATHERMLDFAPLNVLEQHALPAPASTGQ